MVRDTSKSMAAGSGTSTEEPIQTANAYLKRAEQLKRWEESETNRQPIEELNRRLQLARKVKFSDDCVFLAACASGDIEEVGELLKQGADVDTINVDGLTALHQAVIDENLEMVQFLLNHDANVNAQDNEGWTPLMAGVSCNFLHIVKCLLDNGANALLHNNDSEISVDLSESPEMKKLLEDNIRAKGLVVENVREREERMIAEDALICSKLPGKIDDHKNPVTGATLLHVAAAKGYCDALKILLNSGADPNVKDFDEWTPLHAAAHWGEREACQILIDFDANLDELNNASCTCLDVADEDLVPFLENARDEHRKRVKVSLATTNPKCLVVPLEVRDAKRSGTVVSNRSSSDSSSPSPTMATSISNKIHVATTNPPHQSESISKGSEPFVPKSHSISSVTAPQVPSWRQVDKSTAFLSKFVANCQKISSTANIEKLPVNRWTPSSTVTSQQAKAAPSDRAEVSEEKRPPSPAPADPKTRSPESVKRQSPEEKSKIATPSGPPTPRIEESEAERKSRARRERESRRSTQGITLENLKAAEKILTDRNTIKNDAFNKSSKHSNKEFAELVVDPSSSTANSKNPLLKSSVVENINKLIEKIVPEPTPSYVAQFKLNRTEKSDESKEPTKFTAKFIPPPPSTSQDEVNDENQPSSTDQSTSSLENSGLSYQSQQNRTQRRLRASRRSTGPIVVPLAECDPSSSSSTPSIDDEGQAAETCQSTSNLSSTDEIDQHRSNKYCKITDIRSEAKSSVDFRPSPDKGRKSDGNTYKRWSFQKPESTDTNLSEHRNNRPTSYNSSANNSAVINDRFNNVSSISSKFSGINAASDLNLEYKKLYEKELVENERLRKIIVDLEKSLENAKLNAKQAPSDTLHYSSRVEKLVAQLQEENRSLEQMRADNTRLKEENGALIRVISKLSKTK